ncbi:HNH endonuclease signature motif containing protein [Novosphingobium sp.]|uniref:HNH endonuclease n=1 Tax=Novosphingobium sp. TaxID=1874826 RepID=UPI0033401908
MIKGQRYRPPRPGGPPWTLIALILIALAVALVVAWVLFHQPASVAPLSAAQLPAGTLPDRRLTPGAIDTGVGDGDICAHDWAPGDPPVRGGDLTYSKAARHTSTHLKDAVFEEYGIENPHDNGHSWEVDHLVPLSLGGRDVQENLWPESRSGDGMNAWAKDRLEFRLYRLVCDPPPGAPPVPLATAQTALQTDWVAAYQRYCAEETDCPAFGGQ